jgi:hypothetical protein
VGWRRLLTNEIDHEAIWLGVSVLSLGGAWAWLHFALPSPGCPFHQFTGIPCPTCGMTRCLRYTFQSDWKAAADIDPLAFLGYVGIVAYDFYAATVLALRLPRLRFDTVSPRWGQFVRFAAIAAILGNWMYLIWRGV